MDIGSGTGYPAGALSNFAPHKSSKTAAQGGQTMTKERLRKFRDLKAERDDLLEQIEELETMLYGPKGQKLDGMPRGGGGDNCARAAQLDKLKPLREKYNTKVMEMTAELEAIEAAIEPLEPRERRLIRLYYFKGLTWEQVAVEMSYSWRQVHNIHGKALEQLRTTEGETTT